MPLVFLPVTQNYYDTTKFYYGALLAILTALLWIFISVWKKEITIRTSKLLIPLSILFLSLALSVVFSSPNKIEALLYPFGLITICSYIIIIAGSSALISSSESKLLLWIVSVVTTIAGVLSIYQYLGLGKLLLPHISFLSDISWTPLGSKIALLTFLLIMLPVPYYLAYQSFQSKKAFAIGVSTMMALIIVSATVITGYQFTKDFNTIFLPFTASWSIFLEILKNPKYLLTGVGIDNYLFAYTMGRPAWLNITPLSGTQFIIGSSTFLHFITTLGISGILVSFFVIQTLGTSMKKYAQFNLPVLFCFFLLPPTYIFFFLMAILAFHMIRDTDTKVLHIPQSSRYFFLGIASVIGMFVAGLLFLLIQSYRAEYTFYTSFTPAYLSDGMKIYNYQLEATKINPFIARFHAALSQTELRLADAIVRRATENNATKQPTDTERQTAIQFIQQAIREAQITTELAPTNVTAWENLASIYRNISGITEGGDQWIIKAITQAISLDPVNPFLRVSIASTFIQMNQLDNAFQQLIIATQLKPDYANTYYNLAHLYGLRGDLNNRKLLLEKTRSLVASGSADYIKATEELNTVIKQLEASSSGKIIPNPINTPTPRSPRVSTMSSALTSPEMISPLLPTPLELKE